MGLIYIVFSATGLYEDYNTQVEKAFRDKDKAEEYCKYLDNKFNYKPVFDINIWDKVEDELVEFDDSLINEFSYINERDKWEKRDHEINILITKERCKLLRKNGYPDATEEEVDQHKLYEDNKYEDRHPCFIVSAYLEE